MKSPQGRRTAGGSARPDRHSGTLWLPGHRKASSTGQASVNQVGVFVPHEVVFPDLPTDTGEFKRLLRTISRTDAIFWCARLNILVSRNDLDAIATQSKIMRLFLSPEEIGRVNTFASGHDGAEHVRVFFRGQLLELMRWVVLICTDLTDDGTTFNSPDVRHAFARACMLASDMWGRRVYNDRLDGDGPLAELRESALPSVRLANIENAPCPEPFFQLARGASFFLDLMRSRDPSMESLFAEATGGLSTNDYFAMLARVAVDGLRKDVDGLLDPAKSGLLDATLYESVPPPAGSIAKSFFALEAQSADDLRLGLWGDRTDADEQDARDFELRPIRERPIFRAANGRAIILDPRFFSERGSAGPLFHLVRKKSRREAQAFGTVFEEYVQAIFARMYPDAHALARRFFPSPHGVDREGRKIDLNDGFLLGPKTLVVFEMKAVWMPDAAIAHERTAAEYMAELRKRYGVTDNPRESDRPVKGLGQLARTVRNLCDGSWTPTEPSLEGVKRLMPVLLVHDPHVDAPIHSHVLATEFATYLGSESGKLSEELRCERFSISHLTVITLDDLEALETSSKQIAIVECLESYARDCPDRVMSFHNYLASSSFGEKLLVNDQLATRTLELLDATASRLLGRSNSEDTASS